MFLGFPVRGDIDGRRTGESFKAVIPKMPMLFSDRMFGDCSAAISSPKEEDNSAAATLELLRSSASTSEAEAAIKSDKILD